MARQRRIEILGFTVGISVACAMLFATEPVCCKPVWEIDPTAATKCSGYSVTTCEQAPTSGTSGYTLGTGTRVAQCVTYTSSVLALRRACAFGSPGQGWIKVEGELAGGICCWVKTDDFFVTNQTFQITPCTETVCP